MNEIRVSTKGAIVIPSSLRKKLGIMPGDKVTVTEINGKLQIILLSKDPVSSLKGCFKKDKQAKTLIAETRKIDARHKASLASGPKARDKK